MTTTRDTEHARKWEPMKVTHVGNVSDVLQSGGGKLSLTGTDPGESRKTPGSG
jgi:hypothetical protein